MLHFKNTILQFRSVGLFVVNKLNNRHKLSIPITCYGKFIQLQSYKAKTTIESNLRERLDLVTSNTNIITFLTSHLNCSLKDAELLFINNSEFLIENHSNLTDTLQVLEYNGFLKSDIVENFWILFYRKEELKSRLELLKKWRFTQINNGIYLLKLPMMKLLKCTTQTIHELIMFDSMNRIRYFSSFLQCDEKRVCQLFVKYHFMMTIKAESLKKILTMIKDQDILTEDLLSDLWVFRYSPQFILKRIKHLNNIDAKAKCEIIKPWMLRCTEITLNRYFEIREENIAALGTYSNLKDLLINELSLPASQVEEMIFKHPPLAKISYSKAKDMIDFLKAEGFTSSMIYQTPRVLCHKQGTLEARMMELKKISPNLNNLQNLCRNKKDYISFLNKKLF